MHSSIINPKNLWLDEQPLGEKEGGKSMKSLTFIVVVVVFVI